MSDYVNLLDGVSVLQWLGWAQLGATVVAVLIALKAAADGIALLKKSADGEDVPVGIAAAASVLMACCAAIMGGVQGVVFAVMACGLSRPLTGYLSRHIEKRRRQPQAVPSRRMLTSLDGIEQPELRGSEDFADARECRQTPEPEHIPRVTGGTMDRPDLDKDDDDEDEKDREKSSEEKRRTRRDIKLET